MTAGTTTAEVFGASATVADAITTRRSVRAYLDRPVPPAVLRELLTLAGRSPSGSNLQPWKVYVLTGAVLRRFGKTLQTAYLTNEPGHRREYKYYTDPVVEPWLSRRRECGWGLYGTLGIGKGDREKSRQYRARNYEFFGAPVGLVFTIDRRLEQGSWMDYGMFLQTIMLGARGFGLHTCAEAAIAQFPQLVRRELDIDEGEIVVCGMALGYADPDAVVNTFQPRRLPLEEYVKFCGESDDR
jgi:nitroreductase